jgi:protein tyrosine phosphatase
MSYLLSLEGVRGSDLSATARQAVTSAIQGLLSKDFDKALDIEVTVESNTRRADSADISLNIVVDEPAATDCAVLTALINSVIEAGTLVAEIRLSNVQAFLTLSSVSALQSSCSISSASTVGPNVAASESEEASSSLSQESIIAIVAVAAVVLVLLIAIVLFLASGREKRKVDILSLEKVEDNVYELKPMATPPQKSLSRLPRGPQEAQYDNFKIARLPVNLAKNRFRDVLPYDQRRVVLEQQSGQQQTSDYINASFIGSDSNPEQYIAAQSPMPNTIADFWRMIWQQDVGVIAMLGKRREDGHEKTTRYWPQSEGEIMRFGALSITLLEERHLLNHTVRQLEVHNDNDGDSATVYQLQFLAWPDHGVPTDPAPFLDFLRQTKKQQGSHAGPLLVHCHSGVGRTGVFILLDQLLETYKSTGTANILNATTEMRHQRPFMVRRTSEYIFLHTCSLSAIERIPVSGAIGVGSELRQFLEGLSPEGYGKGFEIDVPGRRFLLLDRFLLHSDRKSNPQHTEVTAVRRVLPLFKLSLCPPQKFTILKVNLSFRYLP